MNITTVEDVVSTAVERVGAATVGVRSRGGAGSGIVMAPGTIVTNAHNIRSEQVEVSFLDGRVTTADLVAHDPDVDLAVLQAETEDIDPLRWRAPAGMAGTDAPVRIGTVVVALANPAGSGLRATLGTVSALDQSFRGPRGRRVTGSIEHTAPLLRGSSGGPVVDVDGALVGVNTSRLGEGFYLAIPADDRLRAQIDALGAGETPRRVTLGVAIAPARVARRLRAAVGLPERDGLLVHEVVADGPAAAAGLRRGDLLVSADGRPLTRVDDLHRALDAAGNGSHLELGVVRGADELSVPVSFE